MEWDLEALGKLAQIVGPGVAILLFIFQQWNKERIARHDQTKKKDALRARRDLRIEDDLDDLSERMAALEHQAIPAPVLGHELVRHELCNHGLAPAPKPKKRTRRRGR